ncbi:SpsE Sialic acid synthase [Candidatus Pelagibacterales bacterium]
MKIKNLTITRNTEPIIIAEIGINHNGDLNMAIEMANAAISAGAKIIKHQTHIVSDEMSNEAKEVIPGNSDKSIYEIIESCALNEDDELKLMKHINSKNAVFISTPFSRAAVDRLEKFDVPAYKIGSGECNNYHLVEYIASKKKPIILSTGMNSIDSIKPSVEILRKYKIDFALLHCTNLYPTPSNLVRLNCIKVLAQEFPDAVVGLSDHTEDNLMCYAAIPFGATILERHFTDSYRRKGPDISSSMDAENLKKLIVNSKKIFNAIPGEKKPLDEEAPTIAFAQPSIAVIKDIKKDEIFSKENIFPLRPGGGDFGVIDYKNILGKKASKDLIKGYQLKKNEVS